MVGWADRWLHTQTDRDIGWEEGVRERQKMEREREREKIE